MGRLFFNEVTRVPTSNPHGRAFRDRKIHREQLPVSTRAGELIVWQTPVRLVFNDQHPPPAFGAFPRSDPPSNHQGLSGRNAHGPALFSLCVMPPRQFQMWAI